MCRTYIAEIWIYSWLCNLQHGCTPTYVSSLGGETPKLSFLDVHETGRAERSDSALTSPAVQLLPGSLAQVSVSLSGFTDCLTPRYKDTPWVVLVCLWGWAKWCSFISLVSCRTNSDESGKAQLLWSRCLLQDPTWLQDFWVNVIIPWRKWREEEYVLPLILLLIFISAAHASLLQLCFPCILNHRLE